MEADIQQIRLVIKSSMPIRHGKITHEPQQFENIRRLRRSWYDSSLKFVQFAVIIVDFFFDFLLYFLYYPFFSFGLAAFH